ncbi:MAG: amino acid racemase [Candidatus Heimdallarchaeota archaeon]|nr:amino acid racemase [Candidatus Heimdallarchaeota archaeon]
MKKIGIIGGLSAQSTIEYYRIIVEEFNKIKGGVSSPELIIDSLDLQKISDYMIKNEWDLILEKLVESAIRLIFGGAEIIILATNTPHKVFDKLAPRVAVPMISIMDATAESIIEKQLKKVALIGTRFTMQSTFYKTVLAKYNIEMIVPSEDDQKIIDEIIWSELTHHILSVGSKIKYLQVIERLKHEGAEGVILGCTEIPLLITQDDCDLPVFDTTYLHSMAVLKKSLEE